MNSKMESKRRSTQSSRKQNPRLQILEPELPAIPGLPLAMNKKKEPVDFNDSDSSTCCVSAYYIPGITGKARCLEDTKIRRRPRRSSKTIAARGLYVPSSNSSNRSLPLMDAAYASDDNDEDISALLARSLPGDLTLGDDDDDESEQLSVETLQARETIGRTKVQLETQLGSIRGLLEDHISRTGVKTFKELQSKKKSRRHTQRTVS